MAAEFSQPAVDRASRAVKPTGRAPESHRCQNSVVDTGSGPDANAPDALLTARAEVVHDLGARGLDTAGAVDVVEDVVTARRWWVEQWPDGAALVAGQVAQDVQEKLHDDVGVGWPHCTSPTCGGTEPHELYISPDLGPDPEWVCEVSGTVVAPLGALAPGS